MRAAVLRDVKILASGPADPNSIQARIAPFAGRPGKAAATCIIGRSSACLFLPLFAPTAAQGLGRAWAPQKPSTVLTFNNYNNSKHLRGNPEEATQLAWGLRHQA
jgi:hypothetical protein